MPGILIRDPSLLAMLREAEAGGVAGVLGALGDALVDASQADREAVLRLWGPTPPPVGPWDGKRIAAESFLSDRDLRLGDPLLIEQAWGRLTARVMGEVGVQTLSGRWFAIQARREEEELRMFMARKLRYSVRLSPLGREVSP